MNGEQNANYPINAKARQPEEQIYCQKVIREYEKYIV
jgi:hypothetical protein